MSEILGRVLEITRYPVKSMAGERIPIAEIDWQGIEGDHLDEDWKGRRISFGDSDSAELLITYGAPRCAMITIDPNTAQRDASVLRTVAQKFGNTFTMNASVARPGLLREGAIVTAVGY